jgi:hypothetical protein
MKVYFFIIGVVISIGGFAQTGIGTTTPHASAKLDVSSTNKGFLPPRIALLSINDVATIASPAEGLLVYNSGSVGLQAGYYYWNGANWATIATASLAGNAVVASDLVKLYGELHSKVSGKIGNSTTGFVFTVPVSGKYLFDFTSSATVINGGTNTIYFTVRQGVTVLGSDMQTSYNNNVHVEYNGKVEVNLQSGVSYNVYNYATSGSFENNDYDRVYYKMVAGNLPINQFNLGDVKTGIQSGDHNGWIKLDGRLKSSLTASQQLQATALGIGTNLPNADNAFLVQNGTTIGSVSGNNSITLAQNQLPNVTFTGQIAEVAHGAVIISSATGVFSRVSGASWGNAGGGGNTETFNLSIPLNGGVTQQAINITPKSLSVNTFIYLGN